MMRNLLLLLLSICSGGVFGQFAGYNTSEPEPAKWNFKVSPVSETEYDLIFEADLLPKWHVYSVNNPEGGSLPTKFEYDSLMGFEFVGEPLEKGTQKAYNEIFETDEIFFEDKVFITQRIRLLDVSLKQITGRVVYQACIDVCINLEEDFAFSLQEGVVAQVVKKQVDDKSRQMAQSLIVPLQNKELLIGEQAQERSNLTIFILGFFGGFLALLTPCVFPMVPLTVSFFTKQSGSRKQGIKRAMLYGFFIFLIYVGLSLPFHFLDGVDSEILNKISTSVTLNVIFFFVFVFFAFSFFGFYSISLPSSWSTKLDSASNVGSVLGIFFMALTLAIVSFSCTGPVLGTLLAGTISSDAGAMYLTSGMAGFGFSLALPFIVLAMFPNLLSSLPRSGGWMATFEVVLGFLELAMALKFLSNADLVSHWGILKREVFLGIWIVIFALMTLYLFGFIRFPHDSDKVAIIKLPKVRLSLGVLSGAFTLYLIMGVMGLNSLRILSGFPPPEFYSIVKKENTSKQIVFKDFDQGVAYAQEHNMPILLDFTGWACVNCRKVEEHTWTNSEVAELMHKYVLISLYVDDRKELPKEEIFNFEHANGRVERIDTVGDKWATFQTVNFSSASQPYYVLLSPNLKILNKPVQYVGTSEYKTWLEDGLMKLK